jgi:pyruvate/2-oxoglutarate/acetoin dehydrogenase E1 component
MIAVGQDALRSALAEHLAAGGAFFGEAAGAHGASVGLPGGVRTPLSEGVAVGAAAGSALAGVRTVVELLDPSGLDRALDVVRDLHAVHARSGGAWGAPLVILAPWNPGVRVPEGVRTRVAGLSDDVAPLFRAALAEGRTSVLFLAASALHGRTAGVAAEGAAAEGPRFVGGRADAPVTVLSCGDGVSAALEAVEAGADAEVVDLRTGVPDASDLRARVRRTGRVVVVDAPAALAFVVQEGFLHLESPPVLVAADAVAVRHAVHASLHY